MATLSFVHSGSRPIPLRSVAAHIRIVDVLASVRLSQVFRNHSSGLNTQEPAEAVYRFPVPVGAVVCAFEAVLDDGSTIIGRVKENVEARSDYDKALRAGKQAALAVQNRTDSEWFMMRSSIDSHS